MKRTNLGERICDIEYKSAQPWPAIKKRITRGYLFKALFRNHHHGKVIFTLNASNKEETPLQPFKYLELFITPTDNNGF